MAFMVTMMMDSLFHSERGIVACILRCVQLKTSVMPQRQANLPCFSLYTEQYGTTLALLILSNSICIFVYCTCGYSSHHRFTIFGASKHPSPPRSIRLGSQDVGSMLGADPWFRDLVFCLPREDHNMFLLGLRKVSHLLNINWLYCICRYIAFISEAASTFDVHQVNRPQLAK